MEGITNFFALHKPIFVIGHVFFVILGMGGALISDLLFNFYIKDKKINPTESKTLEMLSKVIWISLALIVLTGLALFMSDPGRYMVSAKFLLKMFVVFVIIINGYMFWIVTHKAIRKINFKDTNYHHKYVKVRRMSFAFGAISMISWFSAFILGSIKSIPVSFWCALGIYGIIIALGVAGSQIVEYLITHKKHY